MEEEGNTESLPERSIEPLQADTTVGQQTGDSSVEIESRCARSGSKISLSRLNSQTDSCTINGVTGEIGAAASSLGSVDSLLAVQPQTSTPLRSGRVLTNGDRVGYQPDCSAYSIEDPDLCIAPPTQSATPTELNPEDLATPIVGYEIMEQRARFTVFKVKVEVTGQDSWFVFRRYTDFVQLNDRLKKYFPAYRLALPPKRWFKNNFDQNFLEDRLLGLQAFVDNVTGHKDVCNSVPAREFFCFDDPPGAYDSLEESRALNESLEEAVYNLRKEVQEKDRDMELVQDELKLYKSQVEMLSKALREQNLACEKARNSPSTPVNSLAECDILACPEADQSRLGIKEDVVKLPESAGTEDTSEHTTFAVAESKFNETDAVAEENETSAAIVPTS